MNILGAKGLASVAVRCDAISGPECGAIYYQTGHFLPMYRDSLVSRDVAIFSSSDISSDLMISHDMSYSPLHLHGNVAGNMHSPIVHTTFLVIGIYHDMSRRVTILQDMIYAKVKFYEA